MGLLDQEEKTEKPTQRRLEKARQKGTVAHSQDFPAVFSLVLGLVVLSSLGGEWSARWNTLWAETAKTLPQVGLDDASWWHPVRVAAGGLALLFVPILVACAGGAFIMGWGQTGFLVSPALLKPDFSRLNPAPGFVKLFSAQNFSNSLKVFCKALGLSWITYRTFQVFLKDAPFLADASPRALGAEGWLLSKKMLWECAWFFLAIAVWDYWREFQRVRGELRMSKQEVKDENKETEGNPQIKSRIKTLMRKMASRRMMERVPTADVVVTNPTHLAVALRYLPKLKAPEVVAKGADNIAWRIRQIAAANNVPIVENKPLAQLLYKKTEVGDPVPVALYQAVAEVLAYVYRLKTRRR